MRNQILIMHYPINTVQLCTLELCQLFIAHARLSKVMYYDFGVVKYGLELYGCDGGEGCS